MLKDGTDLGPELEECQSCHEVVSADEQCACDLADVGRGQDARAQVGPLPFVS